MANAGESIGGGLGAAAGTVVGGPVGTVIGGYLGSKVGGWLGGLGGSSEDDEKRKRLNEVGAAGMGLAGAGLGNYNAMTGRLGGALDYLDATARGQNSVSAEQLRQGMQQGQAAQMSMAAGASPANAAMAARNAANNMARLGYGLSGQQALAGLQERQQAQQAYANLLGQARGQDVQAALGGYNTAASAYGGGLNGSREPSNTAQIANAIAGAATVYNQYQQAKQGQKKGNA